MGQVGAECAFPRATLTRAGSQEERAACVGSVGAPGTRTAVWLLDSQGPEKVWDEDLWVALIPSMPGGKQAGESPEDAWKARPGGRCTGREGRYDR